MAKLSARGATVLARVTRVDSDEEGELLTVRHHVLRSDGEVLRRTRFVHPQDHTRDFSTGWTVFGAKKPDFTTEQWVEAKLAAGWTREG